MQTVNCVLNHLEAILAGCILWLHVYSAEGRLEHKLNCYEAMHSEVGLYMKNKNEKGTKKHVST